MKKIVFTVTNDITYDQRMDRIAAALSGAGYDVTIVGFLKKRSVKTLSKPYHQVRFKLLFLKGKLFFLEYNFRIFWYLIWKQYDIYCGIDLDTLLPVYLQSKLHRKPCVYDAHEYYTELPEIVSRPMIKKWWVRLEQWLLPKIKYNYTVGEAIAKTLGEKYQRPFGVIRNVPLLQQDNAPVQKENFILYQGALNLGRGLEQLMEAMASINSTLYIAGEGDLSAQLRNFAAGLPHHKKIRFLGYVRPDELKSYTQKALLGVNLVEHLGLSYYYSLSNKFFDYIHAGIPQVTMDFPEYRSLNEQYQVAVLIDRPDPKLISDAVNQLLSDSAMYQQLSLNAIAAKKELNWQLEAKKLIEIYNSIE